MIGAKQILRVKDSAHLRRLAEVTAAKLELRVTESTTPLRPYVDHGRWLADCACGAAVACDPQLDLAACLLHRDPDDPQHRTSVVVYTVLDWPAKRAEIAQALRRRTLNRDRSWRRGEPVPTETET